MSELSRLSDLNIADTVLRANFYRIIMAYIDDPESQLSDYTIKVDEEYRPDLISYRAFGDQELAWLVCLVCDCDDVADPLPVGETIYLPSATWVRREIRSFMDLMGLSDG